MKKMTSVLLCLVLLWGSLSVPAQAASPDLSFSCGEEYTAGETFTVNIVASGLNGCTGVSFRMRYDSALLELRSIAVNTPNAQWLPVKNPAYSNDELFVSMTGPKAANLSGVIASVTFSAKESASGSAAFSFTFLSAAGEASSILLTGGSRSVAITPGNRALLTVIPAPGENGQLRLLAELSRADRYCGLTFILRYDSSRYMVSDVSRGQDFSAADGVINPDYAPGEIFISTLFSTPSSLNGLVAAVTLTPIDGTEEAGDVSVRITDFTDSSYLPLEITWAYSPRTITALTRENGTISMGVNLVNTAALTCYYTVAAGCYSPEGQLLACDLSAGIVPAGECFSYSISLPEVSGADCIRLFFLDESGCPIAPAQQIGCP